MFGKKPAARKRPVRQKTSKLYEDAMHPQAPKPDVPSLKPLLTFGAYVLIMASAGVASIAVGQLPFGVGVLVIGVLPAVLVLGMASKLLPRLMGRRAPIQVGELGDWLGEGGEHLVREQSRGLLGPELETLERNRAALAEEACAWLSYVGGGSVEERFGAVELEAEDGARLVGHLFEANPGSERWLVFAHGLDGTWRAGLTYAARAAAAGCNLLFVEMRGHGASGGEWVGASWLDRRDLVCWCRWLVGRAGEGARIVLAGQSLGAASALAACGEHDLPPQVKACVSDSAFTDWWNVSVHAMAAGLGGAQPVPAHPLLDLMRFMLRLRKGGYDVAKARPVDAIVHAKVPVLLIQAADDRMVEPWMAERLAEAAGGVAAGEGHRLLSVPAAGHCCALFADPDAYWAAIGDFLARYL